MTSPQKAIFSLFLSVVLCSGVFILFFTDLFSLFESRFYYPARMKSVFREVSKDADVLNGLLITLESRFSSVLNDPAVKRSFNPEESVPDIVERTRLFELLLGSAADLRIEFLENDDRFLSDKNSLPYETGNEITFSFPVYNSYIHSEQTALFHVSIKTLSDALVSAGRINYGENILVYQNLFGGGSAGIINIRYGRFKDYLTACVPVIQANGYRSAFPLKIAGTEYVLVTERLVHGFYYGHIVNEDILIMPMQLKIIFLVSVFLTVFLGIFLLFNIKRETKSIKDKNSFLLNQNDKAFTIKSSCPENGFDTPDEFVRTEYPEDKTAFCATGETSSGLLAAAQKVSIYKDDDVSCITESASLKPPEEEDLEPFDTSAKIILERDGIPCINNEIFRSEINVDGKLNNDFVKLVNSVVKKKS